MTKQSMFFKIITATLLGLSIFSAACGSPRTSHQTFQVKIAVVGDDIEEWRPSVLDLSAGDTVTWLNNGNFNHYVVSGEKLWPDWKVLPGESFSFTFTKSGNFTFHDDPNTYLGTIEVR